MGVVWDGSSVDDWGTWQGPAGGQGSRAFDEFSGPALPPDAGEDRSIRMRRFEGDFSQWIPGDAGSLSRAQLQGPGVYPMETTRWSSWWVKFNSVAVRVSDDFHMYVESHTPSANPGGVWTGNLSENPTVHKFRNWIGPGSFTHAYVAETPVVFGEWHHHIVECRHSTGGTGVLRYYFDGELMYERFGANTTQSGNHYPEIGFYTYWSVQGTDDMNIAGFRVYDADPGYPGGGGAPVPGVSIITPATSGLVFVESLPYEVSVSDAPSGSELLVALTPAGESATFAVTGDETETGAFDLSGLAADGSSQTLRAELRDDADEILDTETRDLTAYPALAAGDGYAASYFAGDAGDPPDAEWSDPEDRVRNAATATGRLDGAGALVLSATSSAAGLWAGIVAQRTTPIEWSDVPRVLRVVMGAVGGGSSSFFIAGPDSVGAPPLGLSVPYAWPDWLRVEQIGASLRVTRRRDGVVSVLYEAAAPVGPDPYEVAVRLSPISVAVMVAGVEVVAPTPLEVARGSLGVIYLECATNDATTGHDAVFDSVEFMRAKPSAPATPSAVVTEGETEYDVAAAPADDLVTSYAFLIDGQVVAEGASPPITGPELAPGAYTLAVRTANPNPFTEG